MYTFVISYNYLHVLFVSLLLLLHLSARESLHDSLAMPHTSNLNAYYCLPLGSYIGFSNTLRKAASNNLSSLYLCSSNPAEVLACKDKGTFILLNEAAGLELQISTELCQQNRTVTKILLLIKTELY